MTTRRLAMNLAALDDVGDAGFGGVLTAARIADDLGVDMVVLPDHLALNDAAHAARTGFPYPLDVDWFEPLTALAAVAAVTATCRLGTSVLVAPLRPPLLLAKQLATLDAISGGRAEPSFGIGWQEAEFTANGSPFDRRFDALEELIGVCRALWGDGPASADGPRWPFHGMHAVPRPVQGAELPIHLGGKLTRSHADRIVRIADGWAPAPLPVAEFTAGVGLLHERSEAAGRDPQTLRIIANTPLLAHGTRAADVGEPHPLALAERLWAAGADTVLVQPAAHIDDVSDLSAFLGPLLAARDA